MRCSVLVGVPMLAVSIAVPAHADDTTDVAFMLSLDSQHIPYSCIKNEIIRAHAVCLVMQDGTSFLSAASQVQDMKPEWTLSQVGYFVGASIQAYCKDQDSKIPS